MHAFWLFLTNSGPCMEYLRQLCFNKMVQVVESIHN